MPRLRCRHWLSAGTSRERIERVSTAIRQKTPVGSDHFGKLVASRREGYGLPRPFYHDTALYQHEMERIWRQGWVFAGFACQLPNPGDYLTLTLESDPLLVMRSDDGQIRAFHNICTHRGTVLCEQE